MLKMKLPMRTVEDGGDDTAEEERGKGDCNLRVPNSASHTASDSQEDSTRGLGHPLLQLDKEAVFEWFGLQLSPAKRIELMCGLLHMCQPLELRFLGSCLEDLARKDFHVLRDFEIRANSPNDLGLLADVNDPVVRSKLLVCLSLLRSENRECAGILFRILSRVDSALYFKNYGLPMSLYGDSPRLPTHGPCEDREELGSSGKGCGPPLETGYGAMEQLVLLFTMASLHPAFPFHQREAVRVQLDNVKTAIEEEKLHYQQSTDAPFSQNLRHNTEAPVSDGDQSSHVGQPRVLSSQREAVHIEKIVLKAITRTRTDREYSFAVNWSDSSSSSVTRTYHDLENFLLKLPKERSTESFEQSILRLLSQGEELDGGEWERVLKEKFLSAPPAFRQTGKACGFFLPDSNPSCGRCTTGPLSKPCNKEDCSEDSQEEDLEPFTPGHRRKPCSKSPSLGLQSTKSFQTEVRGAPQAEPNGIPDWRRKSTPRPRGVSPVQLQRPADEQRSGLPGPERKTRPAVDREKGKKGAGRPGYTANGIVRPGYTANGIVRPGYTANGIVRPPSAQLLPRSSRKGSGQDVYGETSSESYSSPSSPQHDGQESLESEDEKDRDSDSHSDDSCKGKADGFLPCKGIGGAAVATVRPMVNVPPQPDLSRPENPLGFGFARLAFMQPMPYVVQNGADRKSAGGLGTPLPLVFREPLSPGTALGHSEPASSSLPGLSQGPGPATRPLVQRFKTAAPLPSSEGGNSTPAMHQPPMGAISVIHPGPAYASPLQPAYPNSEPPSGAPVEPHVKTLPPSYGRPVPSATIGQAPPVVPTHTPGPAPTSSPALTHSTAQSDSTSYTNSSSSAAGACQQQQQQQQQHPMGCGSCGCRGSCGSFHAPSYCYPPQLGRQVFSVQPFIHLTSLCGNGYLSQAPPSNGGPQLPFYPPGPLLHTHSDQLLGSQAGYSLQQMAAFSRFYPPLFPSVSMIPGSGGAGAKKSGNVSCYNCGLIGHYAQDCKQPSIDAAQQGGFRLKFVAPPPPPSDGLDKAE